MSPVPSQSPAIAVPAIVLSRFARAAWLLRAAWGRGGSLLVVLAACALWLASSVVLCGTARASEPAEREPEADVPAAMCDPMGASVAVPSDMDLPLVDGGRFEPLPCEALALMLRSDVREASHGHHAVTGDPERPEQTPRELARPRHDGARGSVATFPCSVEPSTLDSLLSIGLAARRGHDRAVYRPPLSPSRA